MRLSNYEHQLQVNDTDGMQNVYSFNSLSYYKFNMDEDTFNLMASSQIEFQIEGTSAKGSVNMNRLLLADKYRLKQDVQIEETIVTEV